MVWVGGRDGYHEVGTHPPGTTGLHFLFGVEWGAPYVAVIAAGLLAAESLL
jgi:hypothetical protein